MKSHNRYNDEAIVLRTYKLKEADRIVVFLTKQNGKIRAIAKGVRKMKNRFGSRLEPGSHIDVQLHKGRGDLDFIVEVETKSQFQKIRSSLKSQDSAFSILEAADLASMEGRPKPKLFDMLLGALNVLESGKFSLVVPAYYLKLLALEGFSPVLDECVGCGASDQPLVRFDYEEGGMCCIKCGSGPRVSAQAWELMSDILGGKLGQVLAKSHSDKIQKEIAGLTVGLLEHRLERGLKAGRNYVQVFE